MPRRLALSALALAAVLVPAGAATSKDDTVTISGRAYVFNHAEQGIAGATIRVRELPKLSATTDEQGDYRLEVPDETTVTPYIEPPAGYNQIDLQTFHTRGKSLDNVNFQTPADAEYNGLAFLLEVPLGPDGRPEQCVIVTTASARNVRGVDFETFRERTPHGVAGATARGKPALPAAIYFNDQVIPDRSRTETSGDGGIVWTEVPAGTYRVITKSPSTRFAGFLATCEAGRIVNANPPWGAYELVGKEKPLGAGIVAGSVERVRGNGSRQISITVDAAERLNVLITASQGGERVHRSKAQIDPGSSGFGLLVPRSAKSKRITVEVKLTDKAGDSVTEKAKVELR